MKKAILCAAALMFGTMAFAQVSGAPVATQVLPIGGAPATANTGESIQNGNDNKVRVRQAGTSQSVYTNQNDGSGSGGNLAKVRQTGAVQPGISGELNLAEVLQSGSANQAQTRQEGDYNNASTRQGQNDDSSSGNKAKIRQGVADQAESNHAAIEQDGNGNLAQTQQTYDNSDAWTTQVGTTNKSMINQDAGPNGTDGHEARVIQLGTNNESFVDQEGAGARNTAFAFQQGVLNQAKQYQTTNAGAGSNMGNEAKIKQGGDNNLLVPVSLNLYNRIANEVFDVRTYGPQNGGPAFNNDALQVQSGKLQEAAIEQKNSDNYAEQRQSGWGHDAMIYQNARGAGSNNYAKQDQRGDINTAGLVQAGSDNKAYQYQQNRENDVLSAQNGDENLLNTHQFGNKNRITTAQHGDENAVLIVQRGGHSYVAQQNIQDSGAGGGNQIDALQLGPNGDFSADGVNCMFMPEVDLNMDYSIPDFELDDVCPDC